jgi:hypothetical protein
MEERVWFRDSAIRITERFGPRAVIVNIGVARGASMHAFRAGAPEAVLYGIDVKKYNTVRPNVLQATIIIANSTRYHRLFDGPVHLLLIDGSHRPEDVMADIQGWGPKTPIGGEVAFHDYYRSEEEYAAQPPSWGARQLIGVREAVDEWWGRPDVSMRWDEIPAVGSIRAFERMMDD